MWKERLSLLHNLKVLFVRTTQQLIDPRHQIIRGRIDSGFCPFAAFKTRLGHKLGTTVLASNGATEKRCTNLNTSTTGGAWLSET